MPKNQGEGLKKRVKALLGLGKSRAVPTIINDAEEEQEFIITIEKLQELNRENSINYRSKVLRELCDIVATRKLEEHAAKAVWSEISDMLQPSTPTEPRQSALRFLACLAAGQAQRLGIMRAQFLRLIESHDVKEDLSHRIDLLITLTDNGKDISYCENFGPFLLRFSTEVLAGDRTEDFLTFLINLVHYNSSFLDKEIITGLVELTCSFCNKAKVEREIESCLQLLDATVRYGGLPSDGLYPLIATLCRTVNIERFCQASWKLMKTLVGTRLGHSAIYIMCCILEDENNLTDSILLRGAVFFIGMCVWGSKRVATLKHKPISLLPSFKQALYCNHPIVAHEIGLSLQRLVKKYGVELQIVTWDIILDLIDMLIKLQQSISSASESLKTTLHDLLTSIEDLYTAGKFDGSADRFFGIIERCSSQRPDSSVLTLLSFLHESIHPAKDGWLDKLKNIMERYFRKETRTAIRVKVLDIISAVLTSYRFWYEEELIDVTVLSYLNDIGIERDPNVRLVTAQLLVDLILTFTSNKCLDILAILRKLINRLMDSSGLAKKSNADQLITDGEHLRDIRIAVSGLITAFKQKLVESPTLVAVKILEILVEHVSLHYINGFTAKTGAEVRLEIFGLFLNIRADERHRLGVIETDDSKEEDETRFSVFATCNPKSRENSQITSNIIGRRPSLTKYCPTWRTFEAILSCLKDEWEWSVLRFVLVNLPDQLRNKTLVLGDGSDITNLCVYLCSMVNDGQFLNKVKNVPAGSGRTDLHNFIFPILAVLVTYNDKIEKARQIDLVKSLELGLNSQCTRLCVICLTICILEMKSVMLRTLPSILIKLSKISATVPMSIPMLEFLSSLKEITELYSNFVEEQYMSIFAIALPYTDAHRYSAYTVTLAHYVIASWFTRCRLSFRKGFVRLITKGLRSSAITRPTQVADKQNPDSKLSNDGRETHEFHEDMTEVCSDMMAKYSFSTISNQPKRSSVAQFLLANGTSQSWLVGNTLVTVTTSGSPLNDCTVCIQRKARHTASKAAAKLRLLTTSIENSDFSRSRPSLPQAVVGTEADAIEIRTDHTLDSNAKQLINTVDMKPALNESAKPLFKVGIDKFPETSPAFSRYPQTEPLPVCGVPESQAVENSDQGKHSRVDSAVEVREEDESFKSKEMVRKELLEQVQQSQQNVQRTREDISNLEEKREMLPEVSLVDRLVLEFEDPSHAFSPTHYLINEKSSFVDTELSSTPSKRFEQAEAEIRQPDALRGKPAEKPDVQAFDVSKSAAPFDSDVPKADKLPRYSVSHGVRQDIAVDAEGLTANDLVKKEAADRKGSKVDKELDSERGNGDLRTSEMQEKISCNTDSDGKTDICREPSHDAHDSKQHEAGVNEKPMKQNYNRMQLSSNTTSQNSSLQVSPLASRRTSLLPSSELALEHRVLEIEKDSPVEVRSRAEVKLELDDVCSCSSESWAEVMIRRPTGNTSWVMKLENVLDPERDFSGVEDIASLAAALEYDSAIHGSQDFDTGTEDKVNSRPRFLSSVTNELSRDRQSNRSSSDSPRSFLNETASDSPNMLRRRRFSTGSIDIPGAFTFSFPSPDPNKEKDETSEGFYGVKYQFEQPSVGFSPLSSFKRAGSSNSFSDSNKDRSSFSFNDSVLSSSHKADTKGDFEACVSLSIPGSSIASTSSSKRNLSDDGRKSKREHTKLTKALSSPTRTDSALSASCVGASDDQRLLSPQPRSSLTESICKELELPLPAYAKKRFVPRTVADSMKKEEPKRMTDGSAEDQQVADKKNVKDQRVGTQPSNVNVKDNQQSESQRIGIPTSKVVQKKEQFRADTQAIREKTSSFSAYRPRVTTISAYPVSRPSQYIKEYANPIPDRSLNSPLNPYFVFLQFFYSPFISAGGTARPLLLNSGEVIDRAVKVLDRIPPYNYHKIGIIYVGPGQQSREACILANQHGSSRYVKFTQGIGKLISLLDCSKTDIYTGGLDRNGADGKFAYSWRDSITQVIFHVATLMPNKQSDPACNSKKLHIGNNFVTIVYNDSNKAYKFGTIKGQFNFAEVVIKPLDYNSNLVSVRVKEELRNVVTNTGPHVISDDNLPILVRQLAVHANMATVLHYSKSKPNDAYGCNWLERLKQIKRIRSKAVVENQGPTMPSNLTSSKGSHQKQTEYPNSDFTDYT